MPDGVDDLIFEGSPVDTFADLASSSGIAALDDEAYMVAAVPLMLRWKIVLSYLPLAASARKFLLALGQISQNSSILMLPCVVWNVRDIGRL